MGLSFHVTDETHPDNLHYYFNRYATWLGTTARPKGKLKEVNVPPSPTVDAIAKAMSALMLPYVKSGLGMHR